MEAKVVNITAMLDGIHYNVIVDPPIYKRTWKDVFMFREWREHFILMTWKIRTHVRELQVRM